MKRWCDECRFMVERCEHKLVVSPESYVVSEIRSAGEVDLGRVTMIALGHLRYDSEWAQHLDAVRHSGPSPAGFIISDAELARMVGVSR
jgi:hypothetical protein